MPRPKKNRAEAVFHGRGHELSTGTKTELLELLGLTENPDPLAIGKIQFALGIFIDGREHLDNIPRPADYVGEFGKLRREASKLLHRIADWTEYYRGQFELHGEDLYAIERALATLVGTSSKVIQEFEGKSSKGAPKNVALRETIWHLHRCFEEFYQGPRSARAVRGASTKRSEQEDRELRFIWLALKDARISRHLPESQLPRVLRQVVREANNTDN